MWCKISRINKIVLILVILFNFTCSFSFAEYVGKFGATYFIAEKDALDEIIEKVRKTNLLEKFLNLRKKLSNFNKVDFKLGKAKKTVTRTYAPVFQLSFDIKDHTGRIIYPKGYTFNPLDYLRFPFVIIFFSGDIKELEWLKKSGYLQRNDVILVLTRGDRVFTELYLGRTVYLAFDKLLEYFSIKNTPTVVYQVSNYFVIQEVGVYG